MGGAEDTANGAIRELYDRVASRLIAYDARLVPAVGELLSVIEPASGWPVTLGVASDGRGNVKLFAATQVDRSMSRAIGSALGRLLGMVQVLPLDDGSEVRRWSAYRIEDIERTPAEADDWATSTMQTLLEELRLRGRTEIGSAQSNADAARPTDSTRGIEVSSGPLIGGDVHPDWLLEPRPTPGGSSAPRQPNDAVESAQSLPAAEQAERERSRLATEVTRLSGVLDEAIRDRDGALGRLRDIEARQSAQVQGADPVPHLMASLELIADGGARVGTSIAVLRRFLEIAPGDLRLQELLGINLLRDDQVGDAIATLSRLGPDGLTPRGASALVEAGFRQKTLPDPLDVLARVDWRVGGVAQQLREVPRWVKRDQLLLIAEFVAQSAPPEFEAFLTEVARSVGRDQLERLFRLWFELEPAAALDQLVGWVAADRAQLGQQWVQDGVRLALGSDDRRTARGALDLLTEDAERRKDARDLLSLVEASRGFLRPADWRVFAVRWLRDAASFTTEAELLDRYASIVIDILRELPFVREEDPEHALASVLERRVSETWAGALRSELARLRPTDVSIRDVTTVAEALRAAMERYPSLVVLPEAERSAAKRGTVGVKKAREALFLLGEIAERYATGDLDQGLDEALAALPDYKPDISDTAKRQFQRQYSRSLSSGKKVRLGPHFDIGGEDGRAYLYVDKDQKRIVLGHCGEHLPGKRDT